MIPIAIKKPRWWVPTEAMEITGGNWSGGFFERIRFTLDQPKL